MDVIEPIQPELHGNMNALAHGLDQVLNGKDFAEEGRQYGFFLAVFAIGDPKPGQRFNYISNVDVLDVERMLSSVLARSADRIEAKGLPPLAERADLMLQCLTRLSALSSLPKFAKEMVVETLAKADGR